MGSDYMDYSIIGYLWLFFIYAFLGWGLEVSFHAVTSGKFVNRGFLIGPVCPIYGFGMVILIFCLNPVLDNVFLLFVGGILLTSLLEFVTGFILEKLFRTKWWDYSDKPFNIKGYICLSFSIAWGLAAVFVINIIHPFINVLISLLDNTLGNVLLVIVFLYFIADLIITVFGVMQISKHLRFHDDIEKQLNYYSENIGESIYSKTSLAIEKLEQARDNHQSKKKGLVEKRLKKSFPNLKERISKLEDNEDKAEK